jgi:hypothetical protein
VQQRSGEIRARRGRQPLDKKLPSAQTVLFVFRIGVRRSQKITLRSVLLRKPRLYRPAVRVER